MLIKKALAALFPVMLLTACGVGDNDKINIGMVAPISGSVSVYGMAASNGSKLAFSEINKTGGLLGREINVMLYDDLHDGGEAARSYQKLTENNAAAVIGGVTSGPTLALVKAAQSNPLPIITPTATEKSITGYGEYIFRACYLDEYQSRVMSAFARDELGAQRAAVLYDSGDPYSIGLAESFRTAFEEAGGEITGFEGYNDSDKNFTEQLKAIGSPDVLYLPDYYNKVALIVTQAREAGIDAVLLGADGWDGLLEVVDDRRLLEGAYYCAHYAADDPASEVQDFIKNYEAMYNQTPNSFAALGYDAAMILSSAIEKAGTDDCNAIIAALKNTQYKGVTGDIAFDANGDPVKQVTVLQIKNEEAKMYKKLYG